MSGSTENRTSDAFEQSSGRSVSFTWSLAQQMLPLVRHIAEDLVRHHEHLATMEKEKASLDRKRHTLAWPARARRYELQEGIATTERDLHAALAELDALGVRLVEPQTGLVGFPTLVNDRPAFFSWRPGEDSLLHWHFADDAVRHRIPSHWTKAAEPRRRENSRAEPRS